MPSVLLLAAGLAEDLPAPTPPMLLAAASCMKVALDMRLFAFLASRDGRGRTKGVSPGPWANTGGLDTGAGE